MALCQPFTELSVRGNVSHITFVYALDGLDDEHILYRYAYNQDHLLLLTQWADGPVAFSH